MLLLEEGQPDYIEQNLHAVLRKAGIATQLGRTCSMAGEYTTQVMREGLREFLRRNRPESLQTHPVADAAAASAAQPEIVEIGARPARPVEQPITFHKHVEGLTAVCRARPASVPAAPSARSSALTLAQETLGQHHISCDIGCHLFSILPPFNLGATTMGYGLGASSAAARRPSARSPSWATAALAQRPVSGIGNAVFNKYDGVIVIVDNYYASATGGRTSCPRAPRTPTAPPTTHRPRRARRAMGAHAGSHLRRAKVRATIEEALTTDVKGPKVIIAQSECMLNKQRASPLFNKAVKEGKRAVKERFGVDPDAAPATTPSGCPAAPR